MCNDFNHIEVLTWLLSHAGERAGLLLITKDCKIYRFLVADTKSSLQHLTWCRIGQKVTQSILTSKKVCQWTLNGQIIKCSQRHQENLSASEQHIQCKTLFFKDPYLPNKNRQRCYLNSDHDMYVTMSFMAIAGASNIQHVRRSPSTPCLTQYRYGRLPPLVKGFNPQWHCLNPTPCCHGNQNRERMGYKW